MFSLFHYQHMTLKKLFSVGLGPLYLLKSLGLPAALPVQVPPYSMEKYNQEIQALYQNKIADPSKPIADNIKNVSQYFLNRPYKLYVMGEGPTGKFDQNPLYRTDLFDCESYVMSVLALSKGHDLASFTQNIIHINYYSSQPNFIYRNHFTSCQWNINNQKNGFIQDITKKIYPDAVDLPTQVNLQQWFNNISPNRIQTLRHLSKQEAVSLLESLRGTEVNPPVLKCSLSYIPTSALTSPHSSVLKKIPQSSIIEIVNSHGKWQNEVSHVGFAIYIHHQLYFREASKIDGKVVDIPFVYYLKHFKNIGINVEQAS